MVPLSSRVRVLALECGYQHPKCTPRLLPSNWLNAYSPQSFERLNARSVAVVIDPIQSVKGKVVIDAFRLINPHSVVLGQEPRQTTSNIGHINKPSIQSLIHGLNRHYYSIAVDYRKSELEQAMLMNLHKRNWTEGLRLRDFSGLSKENEGAVKVRSSLFLSCGGLTMV